MNLIIKRIANGWAVNDPRMALGWLPLPLTEACTEQEAVAFVQALPMSAGMDVEVLPVYCSNECEFPTPQYLDMPDNWYPRG